MQTQKFPHITRFFPANHLSAAIHAFIFLFLLAILAAPTILTNVRITSDVTQRISHNTADSARTFSVFLYRQGQISLATHEDALGEWLTANNSVLGVSTNSQYSASIPSKLSDIKAHESERRKELNYWNTLLQQYPTYLSGYIYAYKLAESLGDTEKAESLKQHIYSIYPNWR